MNTAVDVDTPETNIELRVTALRATFASGRTRPLEWRLTQLTQLERLLVEQEYAIATAIGQDLGRDAHDAWFGDIVGTRAEIKEARRNLRRWVRPKSRRLPLIHRPGRARIQFEPLGVVLIVGPWNYPVFLTLAPLVSAIAAGNAAVIKPSEFAPATSSLLAHLVAKYMDTKAITVIEGDGATTQQLLATGFNHALFTGGTEVGRKIMAGAAATLTPVTLELGGKSPVFVAADADIGVAARRIAWMKLLNSGQTCIAPDYVLVENAVKETLVAEITACFDRQLAAKPSRTQRIVNVRQFDRITSYLESTRGRIVAGGAVDAMQLSIEPTVVVDPHPEEPLMRNEIFGPVLPVIGVPDIDAAIDFVNRRDKPLAAYAFTRSKGTAQRIIDEVSAGSTVVNHVAMHCLVPDLPFGGVGASGFGAYHGRSGFETFSHRKSILVKGTRIDPKIVYPPHSDVQRRILRRLL